MSDESDNMNEPQLALRAAPIVEAVIDIDCDMPPSPDVEALDNATRVALADRYPTPRRRMLSEHQISALRCPALPHQDWQACRSQCL